MDSNWIPVFAGGTQTDSAGNSREWTEDDLDRIVANYQARKDDAPVVVGHPKSDMPAYAWVEALKREGKILLAKFKQIDEKFAEMVNKGRFKYRSIALFPDLRLRHVGFLGAAAPAVAGLGDARFSDDGEFAEIETEIPKGKLTINRLLDTLRTLLYEAQDDAEEDDDDEVEEAEVEEVEEAEEAPEEDSEKEDEEKNKGDKDVDAEKEKEYQAAIAAKDAEIAALKARADEFANAKRAAELNAFCDGLQSEAELTPATRSRLIEFMNSIADAPSFEFSDGDAKKSETPLAMFQKIVTDGLEFLAVGEVATKDKAKKISGSTAGERLSELSKVILDKNPGMTFTKAFELAQKENPELAQEYSQTLQ